MNRKIVLIGVILVLLAIGVFFWFRSGQKTSLSNPISLTTQKPIKPSETFIEYSDPSGFTFSYPDNLSIEKKEVDPDLIGVDENTYADLVLSSNEVSGSLNLKIVDSKYKSLDEWAKLSKGTTKEVNLGSLKATEIKTSDRLLLGALDQGILFTIEVPLIEEDFWIKVYNKILTDFSFVAPEAASTSTEEVIFEGEEVVE